MKDAKISRWLIQGMFYPALIALISVTPSCTKNTEGVTDRIDIALVRMHARFPSIRTGFERNGALDELIDSWQPPNAKTELAVAVKAIRDTISAQTDYYCIHEGDWLVVLPKAEVPGGVGSIGAMTCEYPAAEGTALANYVKEIQPADPKNKFQLLLFSQVSIREMNRPIHIAAGREPVYQLLYKLATPPNRNCWTIDVAVPTRGVADVVFHNSGNFFFRNLTDLESATVKQTTAVQTAENHRSVETASHPDK
jgi:hypothetical protein